MEKKLRKFLMKIGTLCSTDFFFFFYKIYRISQYTEIKLSTVGQIVCYIVKSFKHAQISKFNVLNWCILHGKGEVKLVKKERFASRE